MGEVYLVRHAVLDSEFALKVLSPEVAARTGSFIRRFIREAKLSCRLHHPNLVAVHDAGYESSVGLYYLVMDYVPGGTLRDRLLSQSHGLPVEQAVRIVGEVAAALASAAEMKLVHRDIKPENIMFGECGEARLADLGIAKSAGNDDSLMTMANAVFGTPAYMSPEQARDSGKVDARADIYSLGIVFYEMLCGLRPYKEGAAINIIAQVLSSDPIPDIRSVRADVPEAVAKVLADMCEKNVGRRICSANELLTRLSELPGFVAAPLAIPSSVKLRRYSWWKWLIAIVPCAVVVLGIYEWRYHGNSVVLAVTKYGAPNNDSASASRTDATTRVALKRLPTEPIPSTTAVVNVGNSHSSSLSDKTRHPTAGRKTATAAAVGRYPRVPVNIPQKPDLTRTPPKEELVSGSVVVLGDGSPDEVAFGHAHAHKEAPLATLEAENPARLLRQIDDVIASKPRHVYLKLVGAAQSRGISPDNFGATLFAVADRLHDKNVPFTCIVDPETDENSRYNAAVREVCKLRSYECRQAGDE